ncbi:hypothetical protein D3C75_1206780 [compost metagenome]
MGFTLGEHVFQEEQARGDGERQQQEARGDKLEQPLLYRHQGRHGGQMADLSGLQLPIQTGKLERKEAGDHQHRIGHQGEPYV